MPCCAPIGVNSAVNVRRFAIYLALLIALALAGVALVYWALYACAPPPLPGDELWVARQNLGEAVGLVLRLGTRACFTADPIGSFALWVGSRTTGIILGAAYMLYLYRRVVFGDLTKDDVRAMPDLSLREIALLAPIAAVVLWMGVYPESFLAPMRGDAGILVARIDRAKPAGDSLPTAGHGPVATVEAAK